MAHEMGYTLEDIAQMNISKLAKDTQADLVEKLVKIV